MSKSLKHRAKATKGNEPIAAAEPIFIMGIGSRGMVRDVRCGTPKVVQTRICTASFAVGKKDTLKVVVNGHNRRQTLTLKARKPFSALNLMWVAKRTWESANPVPKNRGAAQDASVQ